MGSQGDSSMTRRNVMTNKHSDGRVPLGRSLSVCICVFLWSVCVVVLYVRHPSRFSPLLRLHLPVGECGVPHALPCVPTPWPTLFDMANINRCCTVTGSSRLLRGRWNRSCFDCVAENSEEVGVQQETAKNHGCVCGGRWGLKGLYEQSLTRMSGVNSWLHQVQLYGSDLIDPQTTRTVI